jgi:hypothetical protein
MPSDGSLPPGWTKNYSNSQKKNYWYHAESKTSQWHPPTKEETKNPLKARKVAEKKARDERRVTEENSRGDGEKKRPSSSSSKDNDRKSSKKSKSASAERSRSKSSSSRHRDRTHSGSGGGDDVDDTKTNVAIIVPYRDIHPKQHRAAHLAKFLPHMTEFLNKLKDAGRLRDFHIYIIEQSDDGRKFNRGKLLNIGFDFAKKSAKHDAFIFHDVDLLPGDDLGSWYARFPKAPIHIARCWDRYSKNPKYFGGIVSFSASDMKKINGYPNTFW